VASRRGEHNAETDRQGRAVAEVVNSAEKCEEKKDFNTEDTEGRRTRRGG